MKLGTIKGRKPNENGAQWTEVAKWARIGKNKSKVIAADKISKKWVRPLAVLVKNEGNSFADALKKVKSQVDSSLTESIIRRLRETRSGALLIEIRGGAAEIVSKKVARAVSNAMISILEPRTLLEIYDLDAVTEKEEIIEAISRDYNTADWDVRLVHMRKTYSGRQAALIVTSREMAENKNFLF